LTGNQTLIARAALAVVAGGASLAVLKSRYRDLPRPAFERIVLIAFVASRFALYLTVFFIFRLAPRGDIPSFYWNEANAVLHHLLPYSGFQSSYAPLHAYLDAAVIRFWYSPLALIFLAICFESLVLPLWFRVGRLFVPENELRAGALLYLTSALSFQFVTIDGQDNAIVAVLLVLVLLLIHMRLNFFSGAAFGVGPAALKFLPMLFVPAFLIVLPRRWRWLAGLTVVLAAVYGIFLFKHVPVLQPFVIEGGFKSPGNLPYVIESIVGLDAPPHLWDAVFLLVFAIILAVAAKAARRATPIDRLRILTFTCTSIVLALLLFAKKSWPPYLIFVLFPICLLVAAKTQKRVILFSLFSIVAVVEHSYWASIFLVYAPQFHRALVALEPRSLILLALQLLLIAGYTWLLLLSMRQLPLRSKPLSDAPSTPSTS
jgi:hypothetical protein